MGSQRPNDRRLDDRHQCHVGICRHHNGTLILGAQHLRNEDGGRAIRRTDDRDGSRVIGSKEHRSRTEGQKDTKLRRRAKNHQLGIGKHRPKVDHRANADKQDQREQLIGNAGIEQCSQSTLCHLPVRTHLVDSAGKRNIDQNGAKAQRQQQRRLHVLGNRQVDEQAADGPHHPVAPVAQCRYIHKQAADFFKNHSQSPHAYYLQLNIKKTLTKAPIRDLCKSLVLNTWCLRTARAPKRWDDDTAQHSR